MTEYYEKCSACGIQCTSDNDVRVGYKSTVGLSLCYSRSDGEKTCSDKVEDAVKEWAENQGQQDLSKYLGSEVMAK